MKKLKYIKLYESFNNIDLEINKYLKTDIFINLPRNFQLCIIINAYESDSIDFSYTGQITDWCNDKNVDVLINDYANSENSDWKIKYGYVPTQLIIEKLTPIIINEYHFSSFQEWHEAYQSTNNANHGESYIAITVDDDDDEWIYDGWHRLNYYLSVGLKQIPVLMYM